MYFCGHRQWRHFYIFQLISTQHFYLGTACADAVFCSVIELHLCISTFTFVKIGHRQWRPLSFHHISSHHFGGHRQWRPFHTYTHISFDFIASYLSGHRLWRLSFLFCHRICTYAFSVSMSFHCVIPLGTAGGDSVSVVRAPPVGTLVISLYRFHRNISLGAACGDSVFCPVIENS